MNEDEGAEAIRSLIKEMKEISDDLEAAQRKIKSLRTADENRKDDVSRVEERLNSLENPPQDPKEWSEARWSGLLGEDFVENNASVSQQWLYSSLQGVKLDPTVFTVAPDMLKLGPTGIEILGVNVTPNWEESVTGRVRSIFSRRTGRNNPEDGGSRDEESGTSSGDNRRLQRIEQGLTNVRTRTRNTNIRVNRLESSVSALRGRATRHDTAIRGLLQGQRSTASASRGEVAARRATAESQRQRRVLGGPTRAAQDAARLRQLESALRAVEDRSRALERAL
ncbi:hypothetical protein ACQ9ZG_20710 [Streptomyces araujoniae]|uniref:hypothetical protein n=1 Tax=Streptomyces sp. ZEA17I TaxID=2202516 RepID=UPI0011B666BF|nr:hypothetical protein [Streptomyces sp. ZEA17I]